MPRSEPARPVPMERLAIVAPAARTREALLAVAASGDVELDEPVGNGAGEGPAAEALRRAGLPAAPARRLAAAAPDLDRLVSDGQGELLRGEAELERVTAGAVERDGVRAWVGWCPGDRVPVLASELARVDSALVRLRRPAGAIPPTLLRPGTRLHDSFAPLVGTYGTVPYADLDPTVLAGVAYVAMFGMMFADAGHGLLILVAAAVLASGRIRRLAGLRRRWPFLAGAGLASAAAGVALGEFFGPTGLLPVLWLSPLDQPVKLLAAGVGMGAVLLAVAYVAGAVNRWREGGVKRALYAPTGIAGAGLFAGLGALAAGLYLGHWGIAGPGAAITAAALLLCAAGLYAGSGGGAAGVAQAGVQLFDLVLRVGANLVSFARLAAFGLTHAALGALVWTAAVALWQRGVVGMAGAVLVFALGNAVTFALEALVAAVQALRLEYYELFSRVFEELGRPFRPWAPPVEEVPR